MRTSLVAQEQGKRLEKARIAAGFHYAKKAAERFGWNYNSYYDHEKGRNKLNNSAAKYAAAFKVSESWLITGAGEAPEQPKIEVLGYAAGSVTGYNVLHNEAIDYVKRPPALDDIPDAYCIYVRGESMRPQFNEGDLCFVHPHRLPKTGDAIIIQEMNNREPPTVFIKTFIRQTETHLYCTQHNPPAEVRFERHRILAIHRVLSTRELFGV